MIPQISTEQSARIWRVVETALEDPEIRARWAAAGSVTK